MLTRHEGQQEEEEVDQHDGLRAQTTPPLGTRPGVPLDPGPPLVGAVTVGYVAAPGPLLAPPVLAGGDGLDESALAFVVQQTLLARDNEEAEAVEAAELAVLEADVAPAERRLLEEVAKGTVSLFSGTSVEVAAVRWFLARDAVEKRKAKRKKRMRRRRRPRSS